MLYCDSCRLSKGWPRPGGFPIIGIKNGKCQVCGKIDDCYDNPASKLTPGAKKTFEEEMIAKIMQEAFREKAEALVITNLSGKLDHGKTKLLRDLFIRRNGEIDWSDTYALRLEAQKGYQRDEESKRNRRTQ